MGKAIDHSTNWRPRYEALNQRVQVLNREKNQNRWWFQINTDQLNRIQGCESEFIYFSMHQRSNTDVAFRRVMNALEKQIEELKKWESRVITKQVTSALLGFGAAAVVIYLSNNFAKRTAGF